MSSAARLGEWTPGDPLRHVGRRIEAWADRLGRTRLWAALTAVVSMAVGVLLAFPTYESMDALGQGEQWRYILSSTAGELVTQEGVAVDTRPINLTWRFVPRAIGSVLGFDAPWQFLVLQALFGLLVFWALARLLDDALPTRALAIIGTVGVAGTWAGATAWIELRGNFDAIALAFLLLAMVTRRSGLVALAVAAALFTDERALMVLPILMIHHARRTGTPGVDGGRENVSLRSILDPRVLAVAVTAAVCLLGRAYLTQKWNLEPLSNLRPGNHPLFDHVTQYPVGIWTALEGGWLVVAAGLSIMWRRRDLIALAPLVASIAVTLFFGLSVFDITRSVAFLLPALPAAALWLGDVSPGWTRRCVGWASAISLLWPLTYAAGPRFVSWFYPFPLPLVDFVAG